MNNYNTNYYRLLGVSPNADLAEIRSAYKKLCKVAHPDVGGSTEAMQLLNEAYRILSEPSARSAYDNWYNKNIRRRQSQPKILIRVLDYDKGEYDIFENISNLPADISRYIHNGELYAFTRETNGKKEKIISSYEIYKIFKEYYSSEGLHCSVITKRGKEKKAYLLTSEIKNNYKKFLNTNGCPLYVKYENKSYIAISAAEYHYMCLSATKTRAAAVSKFWKHFAVIFVFVLLPLGGIIGAYFMNSPQPESNVNYAEPYEDNEEHTPPEKPLLGHNSLWKDYGYSPNFFVKTEESDENYYYYLKFVNTDTNATVQSIFIHAGEPASAYVPNGTYELKWVSGSKWYGFEYYFLNNSAQKADDTFTFDGSTEWTVTLYPVSDGNLSTETINIDEF